MSLKRTTDKTENVIDLKNNEEFKVIDFNNNLMSGHWYHWLTTVATKSVMRALFFQIAGSSLGQFFFEYVGKISAPLGHFSRAGLYFLK